MLERQSQNRFAPLIWGFGCSSLLIVGILLWTSGALANRFAARKPLADRAPQRDHDIEPLTRPPLPSESYVGSEVCATCHSQIARTYQRHPMSRSMATLQASSPIEDYQKRNPFVSGGCAYRQVKGEQQGADPIVNPARLSHAEREAVCYQCHLQASERILSYGRSHQDFRPGQKINDIWTVFQEIGFQLSEIESERARGLVLSLLAEESNNPQMAIESEQFLTRFLMINPTQPQALFRKAHVLGELGEFDSAISFGKQALARDPRRLPLYEWISQTYAKQGDREASEHYLELRDQISRRFTSEPGQ